MAEERGNKLVGLKTVFSFLGYEDLEKYGGGKKQFGVPLCFWLRCLCGKRKAAGSLHPERLPAPEVLYFPFPENKYLIQALLALCCFFGRDGTQRHPLAVVRECDSKPSGEWREYLFLEVGRERAVLVDRVSFRHLRLAANRTDGISLITVVLSQEGGRGRRRLESQWFIQERQNAGSLKIRRIVPVPASELLNGLFRLRKVNSLPSRFERQGPLPERLQTMLLPYLLQKSKRSCRLPAHRTKLVEIPYKISKS